MNNIIPVVFSFDKRIILGASVAIKSLIDCAKETTTYDIRIFHSDLSLKNQKNISKLIENTRHKIKFHLIDEKQFKNAPHNNGSWRLNVYYRLLTPEILKEYDKAIYSDVDVLFKGDLSEVYNTNIEDYEIAAIPSYTTKYLKEIGSKRYFEENKNEKNYISGFLVFNNKLMREEKTVDKFFETIKKYGNRLVYFDMDCLNLPCTRIKDLSMRYCVLETLYEYTDVTKTDEYKAFKTLRSINELKEVINNPIIIHYAGKLGKPWQRKWVPDYYQEYIDKIPKCLRKYTLRDIRKKITTKTKYPIQHFDVGLVNFYHTQNYGACLTAYALQEIIKDLGYSCAYLNEFKIKSKYKLSYSRIFANHYLCKMPKFNSLTRAGKIADRYITGSDQVLRPDYLKKNKAYAKYLLEFVDKNAKKIAFASSFGVGEHEFSISNKSIKQKIQKALQTFDYISTRELSGVDICKSLNLGAEQIMDPVFLLDKQRFISIANKSQKDFSNQLVSYVLDSDESSNEYIKNFANKNNLKLANISLKNDFLSVEDWLKAFFDAEFIITDSYHGACFALIFNKPFFVKINKKRGSSRFETLEKIFGLNNMFIDIPNSTNIPILDYNNINLIIDKEKNKGIGFLKNALAAKI